MGQMLFNAPNGQSPVFVNQAPPVQQPVLQGNPEEIYRDQIAKLQEMGFTNKAVNIQVLQQCFGNVDAAVERLLGMF